MKRSLSILLLLCFLLVSGCREKSSVPATEPDLTPVNETVTVGDFELRATAAGTACPLDALSYVSYTVEIRYVGNEPEVTLFGGSGLFYVRPDPQPSGWNLVPTGEGHYYTLKPGETLTHTYSSLNPKYLTKGQFTMEVIVDFSAGATKASEQHSYTFRFPLTVE